MTFGGRNVPRYQKIAYLCSLNIKYIKMKINYNQTLLLTALTLSLAGTTVAQEAKYDNGIRHKWEFRVETGAMFGSKKDLAGLVNVGVGINATSNLYLGVTSGYYPMFGVVDGSKACSAVPVMGDITLRFNNQSESMSWFLEGRGGILLNMKSKGDLENGPSDYKYTNWTGIEAGPGIYIRPRRNVDVKFTLTYGIGLPADDGYDPSPSETEHMVQLRVGVNLRGKPKTATRQELQAEANRQAAQEALRQEAERKAAREQAEREAEERAREAREARRQQREAQAKAQAEVAAGEQVKLEPFCSITQQMVDGSEYDTKLIELSSMVSSNQVAQIVVKSYKGQFDSDGAMAVVNCMERAEKVIAMLQKKYYIDSRLLSWVVGDYKDLPQGQDSKTYYTILIQKK